MNNFNTSEQNETAAFWKSRFALIGQNETNTRNHFSFAKERSFLTEELKLSEQFSTRLANITDDPLTIFGIITSIFSLLFNRYQSPAVLMIPFLKNETADTGMFPLLLEYQKEDTLKDYLSSSLQMIEDCFNHSGYAVEVLAKEEFGWETIVISDILVASNLHHSLDEKQFNISINIDPEKYEITLAYDPAVFPTYRAKLIQGHLDQIENAFLDFNTVVSAIEILTPGERAYLSGLNPPVKEKTNATLLDLFNETVTNHPDHIALSFEGKSVTYRELDLKSTRLAHYFKQESGVQPGSSIALIMERSDHLIIGILGILKAGAAYVPVDPAYPKERIEYLLTASGAETLVTTSGFLFDVPFFTGNIFAIDLQLDDLPDAAEDFNPVIDSQSTAYIIFTSGSTGKPKGVEVSHASVFNYLNWAKEYYFKSNPDGGNFPLFTPVSFDLTVTSIFIPLIRGKQIEIFGDKDAGEVLHEIFSEYGKADTVKLTPSHISLLADIPPENTNVRTLIVGGEALRADHVAIVKDKWPGITIFNEYGPTEATVGCTVAEVGDGDITIGRPIANTAIYLVDQNRRLLPAGATGEIYIGGVCLAKGYHNQPQLTDSVFVDSPFVNGERLYRTGDLGQWLQNGTLKYAGRKDNQLKIRGYRIETGEIESAILEIKGVKDAAVVSHFHHNNNASLVAFYTSDDNAQLNPGEITHIITQKLPGYMVPPVIRHIGKMPLTPNFKIDRQKLSEMEIAEDDAAYTAPVNAVEQTLVNIFSEVLGREKVSVTDNFFAIGGDSIIGIQIVSRANREGIMITLKQLFKQLTIAGLAAVAEKAEPVMAEQGAVTGNVELMPVHKWFFEQQFSKISHYNQSLILQVDAGFDPVLFEAALIKITAHHDMLRMRVKQNGADYEEYIPDDESIISNFSIGEITDRAEPQTLLLEDMALLQASLDIFNGPVLAARYYKNEAMLLLVAHHLVIDGVSWRILLEDLSAVYNQLKSNQPVNLPEKTSSFKDWAAAAMAYSASRELENEAPFWLNGNRMEASPLPVDLVGSKENNTVGNSLTWSVRLDEDTTQALISTAHTAYHTNVNDLLLAALAMVFGNYTGRRNLLVAMEGHGREDIFDNIDITRTIGWFTSVYPVLLEVNNGSGLLSIIRSIKEQLRSIPNNGIGYGLLKYGNSEDYIKTSLSYLPEPEIIFNYLGQSAQALPLDSDWKISALQTGSDQDGAAIRNYLVEINAIVINNQLLIDWTYSPSLHSGHNIKKLAADYIDALKELITHCLDTESGGYTPSDFPEAGLEQDQLDQLISQFKF